MGLTWGIIGVGRIAGVFATQLPASDGGRLLAVASRHAARAQGLIAGLPPVPDSPSLKAYGSYQALIDDADIEAVYVATPHPSHAEWAIAAMDSGKHVLCEKPMAMNSSEVQQMADAASRNGVVLMEAFMYRCHPQWAGLVELVKEGAVGRVAVIETAFAFAADPDPVSRLFSPALGGGAILDIGCYCASAVRSLAGAAIGTPVAEPENIMASGYIGVTGVDEWAAATCRFQGGVIGQMVAGIRFSHPSQVRVFGTKGTVTVENPWVPSGPGSAAIRVCRHGQTPEVIDSGCQKPLYALEADVFERAVKGDATALSVMSLQDSIGNARLLDAWLGAVASQV